MDFNKNQLEQLAYLAKHAGFTLKQLDQNIPDLPISYLKYSWKKYPTSRPKRWHVVHKRHQLQIIELILLGVNIFSVSRIYKYHPHTVLRFIEQQSIKPEWEIKYCKFCNNKFVSLHKENFCSKILCAKEKKKKYDKIRWQTSQQGDYF